MLFQFLPPERMAIGRGSERVLHQQLLTEQLRGSSSRCFQAQEIQRVSSIWLDGQQALGGRDHTEMGSKQSQ